MTDATSRDQLFIGKLTEIIHANLGNEAFGVNELAKASGMSLYKLGRKLQSINRKTVNQFIREVRLEKALEMLLREDYTVSEVAYRTGFGSPAYFNRCFHEYFGHSPGKIKKGDLGNLEPDILNKLNGNNKPEKISERLNLINYAGFLFIILVIMTVVYFINNRIQMAEKNKELASADSRVSIVVMPFQNLTADTLWNVWQDGIQINLITSLSNSEELKVRQIETVKGLLKSKGYASYMSFSTALASSVAKKLDAAVFLKGNINLAGKILRINAQLINSKTEEPLKSFQIDGSPEMILQMTDSLSMIVNNSIIIFKLEKEKPDALSGKHFVPTVSPEAYRYYIQGQTAFFKNDFSTAIEYYLHALEIDSSLVGAITNISLAYYNQGIYNLGREWIIKSQEKYGLLSLKDKIKNDAIYALYFKTLNDRIKYLRQLINLDDQNPMTYFNIGDCYMEMFEYDKAIPEFEKALEIFHKWDTKPYWAAFYYELGISYHRAGLYKKEKKLYRKADRDFPDDPGLLDQHAWLKLALGDAVGANRYLEKFISVRKEESWSEARIAGYLAYVYNMADMSEKEDEWHRKALSLEPDNPARMNYLAYFLINKDRNVEEGLELINRALEKEPDNSVFLHTRGWGLFKQGNYQEALELLERSWDLRPVYSHSLYLHLEDAKKAATGQI
jgi:tetratricopeptide (TPR) repeat protein